MRPTASRLLNILVPVKRTVDYAVKIRVNAGNVDLNVKHSMNPFDEIAVEEAVRLRERHGQSLISSIKLVTIGPPKAVDVLRTGLAMGADSAIHVEIPESHPAPEPLGVAKALRAVIAKEEQANKVDVVLMGKQAIDDDCGMTGQMLSGLMNWPQALYASKVELLDEQGKSIKVTREIDGGEEVVQCKTPMVLTTDLRLNEPRYASLPNIMKAKKKPINKYTLVDLGLDLSPALQYIKVEEPPSRIGGTKVANVDELIGKLKEAGIEASTSMSTGTSNIVFDDIFTISDIDKEGKKFDRVSRLFAHSKNYEMDLTLDYNVELFPLETHQSFALALASSLSDGTAEDKDAAPVWRPDGRGRKGLEEDYEYVMYGKVYKFDSGTDEIVTAYASFGGLLMSLTGYFRHMTSIVLGDPVYLLMRR